MRQKPKIEEPHSSSLGQLQGFLEWNPAGIYRSSLDGRILDCNEACAHILGYDSREKMLKTDALEEYYNPSDRQEFVARLKSQGSLVNFEIHYRRKDRGHVWALESARIIEGTPPVIEGILIDITDRKRAETRLKAQYQATRVLAESTTLSEAAPQVLKAICESLEWELAALWDVDEQGNALRCANVWQTPAITSREFEQASRRVTLSIGSGLPGRVWQTQRPAWISDVVQDSNFPRTALAAEAGLHAALAFPILTATTMLGVMEFFSRQIQLPDEDLLQMLAAIGSQVGQFMERKRTEAALRQSEERTRLIIEAALDAVVTMDAAGMITGWNPEAVKTFGWRREEALGRRMSETIIPLQHREAHEKGLLRFLETGEGPVLNRRIEITALHRDGREFPIELAICTERVCSGWHFSAFIRDITERKQAEAVLQKSHEELERRVRERTIELLEAKEAAESASRAKSEFLANMSHEIRTPMNGIMGMTELALDTELTPEQREYLQTVKFSAESLLTVLNDILDFSKIEARKLSLEVIEFRMREWLEEIMKSLALRAHQKGIELACHLPEVPALLLGDPTRLRQILVNLVANAIKFTSRGEVVVRVDSKSQSGNQVKLHFAVADTGPGIPSDKQKSIFDAFTQADGSSTRKYGGTGLGLTISSQLAQLMGGHLWVESEVGMGSTFHFTVMLAYTEKPSAPEKLATMDCLRGLRVLVVDDNATNRSILEEMLRRWNSIPILVDSGETALEALKQAKKIMSPFPFCLQTLRCQKWTAFNWWNGFASTLN